MTITTFDISKRNGDDRIFFTVEEADTPAGEQHHGWYGSEVFHPSLEELAELYSQLCKFLEDEGAIDAKDWPDDYRR